MVFLQSLERPDNKRVELEELEIMAAPEPDVADARQKYLNHCLRQLPDDTRELIIQYYRNDGRRKIDDRSAMAKKLGIPLNALRSRVQRIRDRLERCVMQQLKDQNFRQR
jgi:DNA-directed RNA polymerase specialized sigma24 family protein